MLLDTPGMVLKLRHWELSKDPQEHGLSMLKTYGEKINLVYSSPPHQRYDIVIHLQARYWFSA